MDHNVNIYFAPLQGFTDYVYRNAYAECFGGVEKFFTPFLRVEDGEVRKKDAVDLTATAPTMRPSLVPQIIASSREEVYILMQYVISQGFNCCDINFGCPFPQQTARMHGAGILAHPDKVREVLEAAAKYEADLKLSLKMRLGNTDKKECLAIIDIINDAPLSFVTIHPRIGKQMYKGSVDLETFADVAARLKHPVVYNGDIVDNESFSRIATMFPNLNAVMIGRGILSNPFLPESIKTGNQIFDRKKYLNFINLLIEGYQNHFNNSEYMTLDKMKTFWDYPLRGVDKKSVKAIQKARTLSEYVAMVAVGVNGAI